MERRGLGKGLGALIPGDLTGAALDGKGGVQEVPISQIEPNRFQPRNHFDEEALAGLTASIRELGVLQPVLVRRVGPEKYELVAGERRWRAAKRAGLQFIPVLVREVTDALSLQQALVENLHRDDLNPLEEAAAYQQLVEDFRLTQEEVAQRVGKSRSAVANLLRLFQLPPQVQKLVSEGKISAGHAKALLSTPDRAFQEALARRIATEGLTVRDTEEAVRQRQERDADDVANTRSSQGEDRHGPQAGQGRDRVRRPGGPGADLPGHEGVVPGRSPSDRSVRNERAGLRAGSRLSSDS